ncbi:MAG: helix-hairpin-helix domain-containing protein [Planctomycetota bacterium]
MSESELRSVSEAIERRLDKDTSRRVDQLSDSVDFDTAQLSRIPGLGPRSRQTLLQRFGSASAVFQTAPSEVRAVPGVGPKLARKIEEADRLLSDEADRLLSDEAIEAFRDWQAAAAKLAVKLAGWPSDGCGYLHQIHRNLTEDDKFVTHVASSFAQEIKGAAEFLVERLESSTAKAPQKVQSAGPTQARIESVPTKVKPKRKRQADSETRSWTEPELDKGLEKYKAQRSSIYHGLIGQVERGGKGAKKAAQKKFGRNAIGKALGVKRGSWGMISDSPVWQAMADALGLPRKRGPVTVKRKRIGLDLAIEEKAEAEGDSVFQEVALQETIRKIDESDLPPKFTDPLKNRLILGEVTTEQAEQILEATIASIAEEKSNRALPEG